MTTTINDLFPSRFLKASDLKGQRRTVTISRITTEEVGQKKEKKAVLYFAGVSKGLILNKTNAERIAKVTGSIAVNAWANKKVTLYPEEVTFQGNTIEAIRVATVVRASAAAVAPPAIADDDVFADDARETDDDGEVSWGEADGAANLSSADMAALGELVEKT